MLDYSTFEGLVGASVEQSATGAALSKYCTGCSTVLPLTAFYARASKCKECAKAAVRANRLAKLDQYKEYERNRATLPHRVEARNQYEQSDAGKEARGRATNKFRENNPEKYAAHTAVNNAIRDGKLQRWPCEICGDEKSEAHHPDYSMPLVVTWLCRKHHRQAHALANI